MAKTYPVRLTGPQLRVVHEALSVVLNDPDWYDGNSRDASTCANANDKIMEQLRKAWKDNSTPANFK